MSAPERGEGGEEACGGGRARGSFLKHAFNGHSPVKDRHVELTEVCTHGARIQTGITAALIRASSKTVDPCEIGRAHV